MKPAKQAKSERAPAPRPRPFVPPTNLSEWPRESSRTLVLATIALVVGVSAAIIVLRHRAAERRPVAAAEAPAPMVMTARPTVSAAVPPPVATALPLAPTATPLTAPPAAEPAPRAVVGARAAGGPAGSPVAASAPVADTGSVFISTSGSSAAVMVSGNKVGQTPMLVNLPTGHRTVTLVPNNGEPARDLSVDVTANSTVMLNAAFAAAPAAPPAAAAPAPAASSPAP
jgi:pyruvate dehydrogenase E2 component (dihydrolipoamide acetyltransferase)